MEQQKQIEAGLKELEPEIPTRFHVSRIGYFGSLGTDRFSLDNDIDLLVEFSDTIGWELVDLKSFLEEQLDRRVDLVTKKALKKKLKDSVLKQVTYE